MNRKLHRISIALIMSIALNSILMAIPFFVAPEKLQSLAIGKIVSVLGRPGGAFTEWLLPGHDMPQVIMVIVFSLVFYAVLAWLVLRLIFWRGRGMTNATSNPEVFLHQRKK
jgi:hypothetical protein